MDKYFKNIVGVGEYGEYNYFWKSKGLSDEKVNSVTASNYISTPELSYHNASIILKFTGSCLKQDKVKCTHGTIMHISIVYNLIPTINNLNITLENCLFGAVELTKNTDIDKYKYSGYGTGINSKGSFSFLGVGFGKNNKKKIRNNKKKVLHKD